MALYVLLQIIYMKQNKKAKFQKKTFFHYKMTKLFLKMYT